MHVWRAIKGDGSKSIIKCPQRLNSQGYQMVIEDGLTLIYKPEDIFQQDGATCHTSRSSMKFMEDKGINILCDWPPQSPDISIIENTWSVLKRNVEKRKSNSPKELWRIIQEEWNKITREYITKLYDSIPR